MKMKLCVLLVSLLVSSTIGCSWQKQEAGKKLTADEPPLYMTSDGSGCGRNWAEYGNGFYWLKSSRDRYQHIMYFDQEKGNSAILCSQPSCMHDTQQCSAVIYGLVDWIACAGDHLYFIADQSRFEDGYWRTDQSMVLWRADLTGKNREAMYSILDLIEEEKPTDPDASDGYEMQCYGSGGGYLYVWLKHYTVDQNTYEETVISDRLLAFPLDGTIRDTMILEDYRSHTPGYTLLGADSQGSYLLNPDTGCVERETNGLYEKVGDWNLASAKGATVLGENLYYYEPESGVYRWNKSAQKPELLIADTGWKGPVISWGDNGIVIQDDVMSEGFQGNRFRCYDPDGKPVTDWIPIPGMIAVWGYRKEGVFLEDRLARTYYWINAEELSKEALQFQLPETGM